MTGGDSVPLVGDVSRACRVVPGDCSGYRVPLPEVDSAVGCGFSAVTPRALFRTLPWCRLPAFRPVPRALSADVPKKAEIEAVGAFGRRSPVSACASYYELKNAQTD